MRSRLIGLAVAAAAAAAATSPATAAGMPRCHTSGLRASFGRVDAGAGQRDVRLTLRNRSGHACRTQGWVGLQLMRTLSGRATVPTLVIRSRPPSHRVRLDPGERAVATLHWTVIPAPGESESGTCEPTARSVRVTPPDETRSLRLRWPGGVVCQHGRIDVTPLKHR